MREVAVDVERNAVQRDPAFDPDADRRDLVLAPAAALGPRDPDADALLPAFAGDIEGRERADDPRLERRHEAAHVRSAMLEVEHHIGDALARPVIGELAAPTGQMDGKSRVHQFLRLGAGAGGVERRMLEQPHQLGSPALGDGGGARLHERQGHLVRDKAMRDAPLDRSGSRREPDRHLATHVNHPVTIPWSVPILFFGARSYRGHARQSCPRYPGGAGHHNHAGPSGPAARPRRHHRARVVRG